MFDKFMDDLDKRLKERQEKKLENQKAIDEVESKRLRDLRYQERWQNRINWSNNNDQ